MAPGNALRAAARRLTRGRKQFRLWRRGRPFWGGLLMILSGVQLFLSTNLDLLHIEISFGPQGFLAILLPALLCLCGLLTWITPQHRVFYGVIGLLTAIYSLLGLNLGGWFLGTLLGVIGGSLVFAWTPVTPAAADATGPDAGTTEQPPVPPQATGPLADQTPDASQVAPVRAPRQPPRTFVAVALPLTLTAVLAVPALTASSQTDPCAPVTEVTTTTETTGPTDEHEGPDYDTDDSRSLLGRLSDWWTGQWTGSDEPEPTPGPSVEPTPTETVSTASPTAPPCPDTSPSPAGEPAETPTPQPSPSPTEAIEPATPSPTPTPTPPPEVPVPPEHPLVSTDPALMTADVLDLRGFRFEGIAELPTADGTISTLKFTFSRATNTNFVMVTNRAHEPQTITADPLTISGTVEFYATRFTGRALGTIPMTLEPDSPTLILDLLELFDLPLPIFFTDVEQELVFTRGATLTATGFDQS